MTSVARRTLLVVALWLGVVAGGLIARPAWPIDETRYLSVAWDMWTRGEQLVPHLNGVAYSEKPPLLFWLIEAGWAVLGVRESWARIVPALFALASLLLSARVGRRLWPDRPDVGAAAPLLLLSTFLWSFYTTVLLFDMLLVCFTLIGVLGLLRAIERKRGGWLLYAAAVALGILAKGPAILLWLVPAALAAPWWSPGEATRPRAWYPRAAASIAGGIALSLAWAIPAAISGGSAYADAILWNQTAGRLTKAFAHRRPVWWYLPFLPLLVFPWILWAALWRRTTTRRELLSERGVRLCAVWPLSGLALFSLVSGKQIHYLLPLLPPIALFGARLLSASEEGVRRRDLVGVAACILIFAAVLASGPWVEDTFGLPSWVSDVHPAAAAMVAAIGVFLLAAKPRSRLAGLELVAAASLAAVIVTLVAIGRSAAPRYDVSRVARYLADREQEGHPLAHAGRYRGEYQFAGRLKHPLEVIDVVDVERWISRHPDGYVVVYSDRSLEPESGDVLRHEFRGGVVAVRHDRSAGSGLKDRGAPRKN
jgi:4-amino-4-deoxy-L-arabinose transferase-like glycosyltransferase